MKKETFIHGIYPRSESLVATSRGYDRGRVNNQELKKQQIDDQKKLIELQETEGLSFVEDGKIGWQDIFRPFGETTSGLSFDGGITRWFDNNSFYRKPVITGDLNPNFSTLDEYFPEVSEPERWKATLPSPYTFARLSQDNTTNHPQETLENVTQLVKSTIEHLEERGISFIQLNEPYLPYHGAKDQDTDEFINTLSSLNLKERKAKLAVHFYFGDASNIIKKFEDRDRVVDALGVDFYKTRASALPTSVSHDLIAGVVDGRSPLLEKQENLDPFLDRLANHTRPQTLYISHNSDLESLPENIAQQKIKILGGLNKFP